MARNGVMCTWHVTQLVVASYWQEMDDTCNGSRVKSDGIAKENTRRHPAGRGSLRRG